MLPHRPKCNTPTLQKLYVYSHVIVSSHLSHCVCLDVPRCDLIATYTCVFESVVEMHLVEIQHDQLNIYLLVHPT